jgi:hypothetical protein
MASAEDIQQIIVVDFVKQCTNLPVFHIPNQRQTSPQHGVMLKRMGVKRGVADLFFPRGNQHFKGMFLEMKTSTGKPTKEQIQFLNDMRLENYFCIISYGAQEAIETIKAFYALP